MNKGNVSKEYADQRYRDSPLHKLKTCTYPTNNPLFDSKKEEQDAGSDESDR